MKLRAKVDNSRCKDPVVTTVVKLVRVLKFRLDFASSECVQKTELSC